MKFTDYPSVLAIPVKKVNLSLKAATPTPVTVDGLKKMLDDVGLNCAAADKTLLEQYIVEVSSQLPDGGATETYRILRPAATGEEPLAGFLQDYQTSSEGNYEPTEGSGYNIELETIIYKDNFRKLKEHFAAGENRFNGVEGSDDKSERYESVNSIKSMFVDVGTNASSILITGLDQDSIKSVLSNAIAPLDDSNAKDYNKTQSRVIFLVNGYVPATQEANAIGVLGIEWTLEIKDYKQKKKAMKYDTKLHIEMRAATFDSLVFEEYYNYLISKESRLGSGHFGAIPVHDPVVKIFDTLPAASSDTYKQSLPIEATEDGSVVIVLYSPDLQAVGSLDNSQSAVTSSYAKSIMTGFTFSSTQTISATASFEAGIVIAKGSLEIGFSLSLTEEYTKQTTETTSFECPAGEKAFLYQGSLLSAKLQYSPVDQSFKYLPEKAKFLTDVFATTKDPLVDKKATIVGGISRVTPRAAA